MENEVIKFIRQKDYVFIKEISQGGFGKTVLLKDETIDTLFVCKKYEPYYPELKEDFFKNFIQEIKILHLVSHANIVRVFNYYLYPERFTGYILMEFIEGNNLDKFLHARPESINEIFVQVIEGFRYLESIKILHRDIRPQNILVDSNEKAKIIDFGFGKKVAFSKDFNKSISLNWWCDLPDDFSENKYDHSTEIYFVGKLFEKAILDNEIEVFAYKEILNQMIKFEKKDRIKSFNDINRALLNQENITIDFSDPEIQTYQRFADSFVPLFSKIESNAQYVIDIDQLIHKLETLYKKNLLEEAVQNSVELTRCFVSGEYRYYKEKTIYVSWLKNFIDLLKKNPKEKQKIIINNLYNRLDAIDRFTSSSDLDDDIPF